MIRRQIFAVLALGFMSLGLRADVVVSFSGNTASSSAGSFTAYSFQTTALGSNLILGGFGLKTVSGTVSGSGNINLRDMSSGLVVATSTLSGTIGSSLFTAAFNAGNFQLSNGTTYQVEAAFNLSGGSLAQAGTYSVVTAYNPYIVSVTEASGGSGNPGIALVTAVPEPGTMVLFGCTLLLGVGFVWLRNRHKALQMA